MKQIAPYQIKNSNVWDLDQRGYTHYAANDITRLMHLQQAHVSIDGMVQNIWCNWMTIDE